MKIGLPPDTMTPELRDAPPLLVFDLDGTLVDTAPDLTASLNHVLVSEGLAPIDRAMARAMIGRGGRYMIERGFDAHGIVPQAQRMDEMVRAFLAHYTANIAVDSRPFPGVLSALDRLTARGWRFAVCTNKLERLSRHLLEALSMTDRFQAICGADTFEVHKPHPDHLLGTVAAAGGRPDRAIMIGDSQTDIKTAQAAKIPVIAVDFGYTDAPVETFGPNHVISHFDALDAAVAALAAGTTAR